MPSFLGIIASAIDIPANRYGFGENAGLGLNTSTGNTLVPSNGPNLVQFYDWTFISMGGAFGLAIRDGKLYSFGSNANGRSGQNTTTGTTLVPTQIGTDSDWTWASAGLIHALAIRDGKLYSWGNNIYGRTGLNTNADTNTLVPTQVGTDTDWTVASAGVLHSLAIRDGGKLYSFGYNSEGRTGQNTAGNSNTIVPTQVGADTDWSEASAGGSMSLAIRAGRIYSFGSNANGRTGLNTTVGNTVVPTQIGVATSWVGCSAGSSHCLVRGTGGRLYSFGINASGRTGQNTTTGNTLVPTQVGFATFGWSWASAGNTHSLGILSGELRSFGSNANGKTGLNTTTGNTLVNTQIGSIANWTRASAGDSGSLALRQPS